MSQHDKPDSLKHQFGGTHYKTMAIQPVEYIEANEIPFSEACAIKYLTRHRDKGGAGDLKKAIHFAVMALERRYGVKTQFAFSDETVIKPMDSPPIADSKTAEDLVREVYRNATYYKRGSGVAIDRDTGDSTYFWISDVRNTREEAWQSALDRIQQQQQAKTEPRP